MMKKLSSKKSLDNIRQQVDKKEKSIINIIRRKQLVLFGHVCRMPIHLLVKTFLLGSNFYDKKAMLSQGNRAMPQLFFSV